ncbi:hypothetical protein K456DRAFT_1728734 [Colletotrichum gloeosporioides 23]|nr:hypothetical protein K456DRAFT_1728734 [Colletotrichum gloeosporioides 23]
MKTLSDEELTNLAGNYFAPKGLYRHTKGLPFLGSLECNTKTLIAGQWTELIVEYTVGASGLADGAWIKGTFKFYSDWALFQTSDPKEDNYVSLEYTSGPLHEGQTAATVQSLAVRFDQKGHERPFQKAIIVDIVDGYMNPGDKITPTTYDPDHAPQRNLKAEVKLIKVGSKAEVVQTKTLPFAAQGWTVMNDTYEFVKDGDDDLVVAVIDGEGSVIATATDYVSVDASLPISRPLYSDLHEIAGLDVVGYTANDFNITKEKWEHTLEIIKRVVSPGEFIVFPGTEWCGNSAAGGDHNVVFLDDPKTSQPEFPFDKKGNVARSFEWNEDGPAELIPGAWPLDEVYATYAHSPESHLLIPHVGGRRCNLAWHHPQLERLLEIGSAWGLFEWLLRDAVVFETRTSGDFDGVDIFLDDTSETPSTISVSGHLGGYVKVGDALKGNSHNPQPRFNLVATAKDFTQEGGVRDDIVGGADLFVSIDGLLDVPLPKRVEGSFTVKAESGSGGDRAVYFVGREYGGGKVITSPVFIKYE